MGIRYARLAEMEDRGGEDGAGVALGHAFDQMLQIADSAAGDHGDVDRVGDGSGEFEVVAVARAVAVHAGDEQFACAKLRESDRMVQRVDACRLSPAVGEDLPSFALRRAQGLRTSGIDDASGIDRSNNALAAEALGNIRYNLGSRHRRAVDRDLVRAC